MGLVNVLATQEKKSKYYQENKELLPDELRDYSIEEIKRDRKLRKDLKAQYKR